MSTVQAPHREVSQPTCVPVRPVFSRKKWTRSRRGSTEARRSTPFTVMFTLFVIGFPTACGFGQESFEAANNNKRRGGFTSCDQRNYGALVKAAFPAAFPMLKLNDNVPSRTD